MGRDAPVQPLVDLAGWIADDVAVVLLTGRPEDHAPVIRRWLGEHGVTYDELLMRPAGDRRPDTVVKRERYRRDVAPRYEVRLAIDDRPKVIEMWREEGVYVLTAVDPAERYAILLTNRVNPTSANQGHVPLRRAIGDAVQAAILDAPLIDWESRR
jgi:hypothetical protein